MDSPGDILIDFICWGYPLHVKIWRIMREHRYDNSLTGKFVVSVTIFMHLKRAFQITMKKFCTKFWAQFWGCILYSSATYIRINMLP